VVLGDVCEIYNDCDVEGCIAGRVRDFGCLIFVVFLSACWVWGAITRTVAPMQACDTFGMMLRALRSHTGLFLLVQEKVRLIRNGISLAH